MGFTATQEKQLLLHMVSKGNPHAVTFTQTGINSTDDLAEGSVNKYQHLYTFPEDIKQALLDAGFTLPDTTTNLTVNDTLNILFNFLSQR